MAARVSGVRPSDEAASTFAPPIDKSADTQSFNPLSATKCSAVSCFSCGFVVDWFIVDLGRLIYPINYC